MPAIVRIGRSALLLCQQRDEVISRMFFVPGIFFEIDRMDFSIAFARCAFWLEGEVGVTRTFTS